MRGIDTRKSLEELEGDYWGAADANSSPITAECHMLRRLPLCDLTPGDLLLLIRRNVSLQRLVPLALDLVDADPLVEGCYYPGDLVVALLRSEGGFWDRNPEFCRRLIAIGRKTIEEAEAAKKAAEQSPYGLESIEFTDLELLASCYAQFLELHHRC